MEKFQILLPSPELAPYIRHYWLLETDAAMHGSERIIPTGNIQLLFYRGDPMTLSSAKETKLIHHQSLLCGQSIGYSDLALSGRIRIIAVVFHSYGARAFFPVPMNEFDNRKVVVADMEDLPLKELEEQVMLADDDTACIRLIETFLRQRLHRLNPLKEYNYKRMWTAIRLIDQSKGQIRLSNLSASVCLSDKQFQRIFTEHAGIGPKDYLRIVRFQYALSVMQSSPTTSFAQLAGECGYYDQSHLINEFKIFAGYTPKEYLAICDPYSDYFSGENN